MFRVEAFIRAWRPTKDSKRATPKWNNSLKNCQNKHNHFQLNYLIEEREHQKHFLRTSPRMFLLGQNCCWRCSPDLFICSSDSNHPNWISRAVSRTGTLTNSRPFEALTEAVFPRRIPACCCPSIFEPFTRHVFWFVTLIKELGQKYSEVVMNSRRWNSAFSCLETNLGLPSFCWIYAKKIERKVHDSLFTLQ